MSLTVKDLKEIINRKGLKDDSIITDQYLSDFIHITHDTEGNIRLCKDRPIGRCNRTGEYVYPSDLPEYSGYCPELDENLDQGEYTKLNHKKGER